ncbi:hypothetical protein ABZ719_08610 [Streptomyces sp. NPDC006743]|uniref:hypothetical protein n=1 Tax=Streptomyces sp. NPDC006743 TaxID=3154480 RepID=UPI003451931E
MSAEDLNAHAWTVYGQRQLTRAFVPPVPRRMNWAPWEGVGPGPVRPRAVPAHPARAVLP